MAQGLLYGLGKGFESGINAFNQARQMKLEEAKQAGLIKHQEDLLEFQREQEKRRIQQDEAELAHKGMIKDPSGIGGGYIKSPETRRAEAMKRASESAGLLGAGYKPEWNEETGEYDLNPLAGGGKNQLHQTKTQLEIDELRRKAAEGPKPAQNEFQAASYGNRAQEAHQILTGLEKSGKTGAEKSALIGNIVPNILKPEEFQQRAQAKIQFVNSILRDESGASISPEERKAAELQYFAQPGDKPSVVAQKDRARQIAIDGLRAESGKAWDKARSLNSSAPKGLVDPTRKLAPQDQQAVEWAVKNPKDPRSAAILKANGM